MGRSITWAWKGPSGKPGFNFVFDWRDFSMSGRVLIRATGFNEYTARVTQAPQFRR
jgi:hypothetical protein